MEFFEEFNDSENEHREYTSEKDIEDRIKKAKEIIENGEILLNTNFLEDTLQLCAEYDYPEDGLYIVDNLLENLSLNSDLWELKGIFHNALGDFDKAKKAFEKSLELNPNDLETLINLSAAYENAGEYQEASKVLDSVIQNEPENTEALMALGMLHEKKGLFEKAIEYFKKVIEIDKDNSDAWYELGFTLENIGKYKEASEAYSNFINLEPESYYGWYNRGIVLLQLGKFEDAIEHFDIATALNKKFASAYFNLGITYLTIGKNFDAIEAFRNTLKLEKDDETAWYYLGKALLAEDKYDEAIKAFTETIKIEPTFQDAFISRGKAKEKIGDPYGALSDFNNALLITLTNITEGRKWFEKYDKNNPFEVALQVIDEHLVQKNYSSALNMINIFEKVSPNSSQLALRRAIIFFKLGEFSKGLDVLKSALKNDKELLDKVKNALNALKDSELINKLMDKNFKK